MNKRFLLVILVTLVSLIAVNCTCGGFPEPPYPGQTGEPPPGEPMVFFAADRTNIQPGECVILKWNVEGEGFFGVELNGQPVDPSGHQQVCPHETDIYTLGVDIGHEMLHREVFVSEQANHNHQRHRLDPASHHNSPNHHRQAVLVHQHLLILRQILTSL